MSSFDQKQAIVNASTPTTALRQLAEAELQRIEDAQEEILRQVDEFQNDAASAHDDKSPVLSPKEKHIKLEKKINELLNLRESVDSLLESAMWIANYLERLQISMASAGRDAKL